MEIVHELAAEVRIDQNEHLVYPKRSRKKVKMNQVKLKIGTGGVKAAFIEVLEFDKKEKVVMKMGLQKVHSIV